MKLVLLKSVHSHGKAGDIIEVPDGYARNYLIPRGFAVEPDDREATRAIKDRADHELSEARDRAKREQASRTLKGRTIEISRSGSEHGHLYAGVSFQEISDAIKSELRVDVDPSHLESDGPLKSFGEHILRFRSGNQRITFSVFIKHQ